MFERTANLPSGETSREPLPLPGVSRNRGFAIPLGSATQIPAGSKHSVDHAIALVPRIRVGWPSSGPASRPQATAPSLEMSAVSPVLIFIVTYDAKPVTSLFSNVMTVASSTQAAVSPTATAPAPGAAASATTA